MFSLVELKTAILDTGIPGISPAATALLFLLMFAVSMFPYALFYLSLREKQTKAPEPAGAQPGPFTKMTAWMHAHRHPQLLHH